MKRIFILFAIFISFTSRLFAQSDADKFVDELMSKMTLEEKVGQLIQYTDDIDHTGPMTKDVDKKNQIKTGWVGSMLNTKGAKNTRAMQDLAMQSRLKIPLLFGLDVIHGFRTTFPIPLGETATWDLALMEKSARIAATEAAAWGLHWTFAPMVDIARDPRWGRVMEGSGEDTYLGSLAAIARVKGFQGAGLGNTDAVMACAKHFAAYGAAVGGRDYNSVDMSYRQLHETYLPPFKAASDAGAATFMNSFNDINGIPATGNSYIQRDLLKGQWGFKGFVVSDWGSIGEMIAHGYAADLKDAALKAILAGSDMDMESRAYKNHLVQLVNENKVDIKFVDDAVKRILIKKYELGLFNDPYKFCNETKEKEQTDNMKNRDFAREIGSKSIVLLQNNKQTLPLSASGKKIALIGPFAKETVANHGFWSVTFPDDSKRIVSQYDGILNHLDKDSKLYYAKGCNSNDNDTSGFKEALKVAKKSDVVIVSVGEPHDMSGEARSRSSIRLTGVQEDLIRELHKAGKPMVILVNAGRPLVWDDVIDNADAILYTWWLGTEAGNSIADVLFGYYNPAGKLPITFPRSEGQIPIYYNHYNTGRPAIDENKVYTSAYLDLPTTPKYPFGYGLSYSTFDIKDLKLSSTEITPNQTLNVNVKITNTGNFDGEEVVQLYIRDLVGSVVRPVKELKGFQKVFIKKGESKTLTFQLSADDLKFYNENLEFVYEPGEFEVFVGNSSATQMKANFKLIQ